MWFLTALWFVFLVSSAGCKQAIPKSTPAKASTSLGANEQARTESRGSSSSASSSSSVLPKEDVVPPNHINGALLHCAFASDPMDKQAEVVVGCRFQDQAGTRIPLKDIAELSVFSYAAPTSSTAEITVQPLLDTTTYDVAYFFRDKDQNAAIEIAKETEVKVAFKNLANGEKERGISVKLSSVLASAKAYIRELRIQGANKFAVISAKASEWKEEAVAKLDQAQNAIESVFRKIFD